MIPILLAATLMSEGPVEISADHADFEKNRLVFSEKVEIRMPESVSLKCGSAALDTESKELVLTGTEGDRISYTQDNLSITCLRIITSLAHKFPVRDLAAEGNVRIVYDDTITAHADSGYYRESAEGEGTLTLAAAEESGECRLCHVRGDSISASTITFQPGQNTLSFTNPSGIFATEPFETRVTAKNLVWNLQEHLISLSKNISVIQSGFGSLKASESLQIRQDVDNRVRTVEGAGVINASLPGDQKLFADGTFVLDNEANQLVIHGAPIKFKDKLGVIEAEHATISYHKFIPVHITLGGNVRIQNYAAVDNIASETCLHYILTDEATLDLATQTLRISAEAGKRALLYDNINNIQVSAPAITLQRNKATKKESLKGEGDVRFSFSEKELTLFKQRFKMMKNAK